MKKKFKLLSSALLALTVAGCSCSAGYNVALNDSSSIISGGKSSTTLTTQDVFDYISDTNSQTYNKAFILEIVKTALKEKSGYSANELTATYNYKLTKIFEEYMEDETYFANGEFDEELLVAKLRSEMANIGNPITGATGPTYDLGLKYDYSKYINNVLDYEIYMELLKEDYIANNKSSILNKSKSRIITVYSTENIEDMEEIVNDIFSGKYDSLEDLEKTKKEEARKEIGRQYCENLGLVNEYFVDENGKIVESCSPTKSSYDSSYSKFTTCENDRKCSLEDGLEYQIKLVDEKVYLDEQVINKDSSEILYENLLNQLLRDDVKNHLLSDAKMEEIFGAEFASSGKFLMAATADTEIFNNKSIILSSGPDSTCYLVLVKVVDSNTTDLEDMQKALELLHGSVSETSVLLHYTSQLDVEINEAELKEAYKGIFE